MEVGVFLAWLRTVTLVSLLSLTQSFATVLWNAKNVYRISEYTNATILSLHLAWPFEEDLLWEKYNSFVVMLKLSGWTGPCIRLTQLFYFVTGATTSVQVSTQAVIWYIIVREYQYVGHKCFQNRIESIASSKPFRNLVFVLSYIYACYIDVVTFFN